ncbi:hypothetical protein B0H98_102207 [Vreelandella songnenensis]|uniref:Nickel/cobalt transporter regulator n=1 Tax=Vreelandella songnenensis TaxID=1176243 RepID=A0A2T0V668_9GAMM|nr:anti-virulence regulator CigR family protein [Halomonas songnenensis]PRY65679.1 hypothetical protein B0H98_102207 [Halomonas songnenensis]
MKWQKIQVFIGALSMVLMADSAFAQPAHAPAHGARHQQGHDGEHHPRGARHSNGERASSQVDLPRINERELVRLLRQYDAPSAEPLPPGIQRQIERGKPLPPGIAKRFDGALVAQLPHYPGYEWERVGADVILIEAATRVVVDIVVDALRR